MSTKKPIKSPVKPSPSKPKAKSSAQIAVTPRAPAKRTPKPAPATPTKAASKPTAAALTPKPNPAPLPLRPGSKQAQLLNLLQTDGATISQMMKLTGWQAHTLRATLSAVFRKRLGLTIQTKATEGSSARMYRIATASV